MKSYFSVVGEYECEYTVERSRFITYVKHVESEDDAKNFVTAIKKKNSLATHNCYAYVADEDGLVRKFSDDGEPQGTAGMPMLEVLKNRNLRKTAVVVTRYFGGIKLGAGGLVRAYSKAACDGLDGAKTAEFIFAVKLKIVLEYDGYAKFLKFNENRKVAVTDTKFESSVTVSLCVPESDAEKYTTDLKDYFNGKVGVSVIDKQYFPF